MAKRPTFELQTCKPLQATVSAFNAYLLSMNLMTPLLLRFSVSRILNLLRNIFEVFMDLVETSLTSRQMPSVHLNSFTQVPSQKN